MSGGTGYALLLSDGRTSPWHKTRELIDNPAYRGAFRGLGRGVRVVGIARCREKPEWLRRLAGLPKDGQWYPRLRISDRDAGWQATRATRVDEDKVLHYEYDVATRETDEGTQRFAMTFGDEASCAVRCAILNAGGGPMVYDLRSSFPCPSDRHDNVENFGDAMREIAGPETYGTHGDEFP